MSLKRKKSISDLLKEYFKRHPMGNLRHGPVVDWVEEKYLKLHNRKPRDVWRAIRKLHEEGFLIKVKKGVYRYDPGRMNQKNMDDFTPEQKKQVLERDCYKCVICGRGKKDGIELHIDHIRPRYLGGTSQVRNGQTLCAQHNFFKKTLKQTETGKKMFIRLYELSKKEKNGKLKRFCTDILEMYEQHDINGHIDWKR